MAFSVSQPNVEREGEIARGVAIAAMRQRLGDIGTAIPLGALRGVIRSCPWGWSWKNSRRLRGFTGFSESSTDAVRYLADQDLKDIGVLPVHRLIMLAAIGELAGPAVTTPPSSRPAKGVKWPCAERHPSVNATMIHVSQSLSREMILAKLTGSCAPPLRTRTLVSKGLS